MKEYEHALRIRQRQVMRDPNNQSYQRDLAIIRERMGDLLVRVGHVKKAIKSFEAATLPVETLIDRDPSNQRARQDLIVLLFKLWKLSLHEEDADRAKTHRETAERMIREMEEAGKPLPGPVAQAKAKFNAAQPDE